MRFRDPVRYQRKRDRKNRRMRGISLTRRSRVFCVKLNGMPMPEWCHERRVSGLSMTAGTVWLRPRDALHLGHLAYEAGFEPTLVETEFRLCEICGRTLLGEDAAARRRTCESSVTGRMLPCGSECLDAEKDKRWRVKGK